MPAGLYVPDSVRLTGLGYYSAVQPDALVPDSVAFARLSFGFRTVQSKGLAVILWVDYLEAGEFLGVWLSDGRLAAAFSIGECLVNTTSAVFAADGRWHAVSFTRSDVLLTLDVDGVSASSAGAGCSLYVSGTSTAAYMGGLPASSSAAASFSSLTGLLTSPQNLTGCLAALRSARQLAPFALWNALTLQDTSAWTPSSPQMLPQYCFEGTLSAATSTSGPSSSRSVHMFGATSYVRFQINGPRAVLDEKLVIELQVIDTTAPCDSKTLFTLTAQQSLVLRVDSNCSHATAAIQLWNASTILSVPATNSFPNASSLVLSLSQDPSNSAVSLFSLAFVSGLSIQNASAPIASPMASSFTTNLSVTLGANSGRGIDHLFNRTIRIYLKQFTQF